jgi:p-cumate 2,3-dioxygenase beta subunit
MSTTSLRSEVEDFLYREASLLDSWKLDQWLDLFAPDTFYGVPSPDAPDSNSDTSLFLIADDRARLADRVTQLLGKEVWAERPRSRTRRMITNVVPDSEVNGEIVVWSNFVLYRTRLDKIGVFFGRHNHVLQRVKGGFAIRRRLSVLDLESLQSVGKISFIL